ncbi:MAG TPA: OmpH family outer membrane protein [Phycisphaerales bacterium]|nr:OmpH family outer membrane protein [Phycisphaerales bacterium]
MMIRGISNSGRAGVVALVIAAIGLGMTLGPGSADASAVRSAGATAVAAVDLAKLLDGLDERAALEADLNKQIERRQAELDQIADEIKKMNDDIAVLKEDDPGRIEKIRDLRIKEVQAKAMRQFIQEQLSVEKGRMLADLYKKIQSAVCDIAARDGWDLILIDDSGLDLPEMATEQQMLQLILSRRVLCAGGSVDVTDEVKTLMNNRFNTAKP